MPTAPLEPTPTPDTRLFDENNRMICTIYPGFFPELTPEQEAMLSVFPAVNDNDWALGPADASLTILEYSDFECPACASFYTELEKLVEKYPDDVRLVYRHFPLTTIHPNATKAAQASEAAGLQGKFWEMYHALFSSQQSWAPLEADAFVTWLEDKAEEVGLDRAKFSTDLASEEVAALVQADVDEAMSIGLNSTPTVLLNGRPWQYSWDAGTLGMVLEVLKYETDLYTECPPWVIEAGKEYTATIETENGEIVLELYPDKAPLAVNSFIFLAREGFYDGVTFHRVMPEFVAQAGDPSGTGISSAGYEFRDEIAPDLAFDQEGMLGMANSGPNTNGSQFFITNVANESTQNLTGTYTIFGKVIEGMDVLKMITPRDPQTTQDPPPGDKIITITIEEK